MELNDIEEKSLEFDIDKDKNLKDLIGEECFYALETLKNNYQNIEKEIESIRDNYSEDRYEKWNQKMLSLVKIENYIENFIGKKFK